MSKQDILSLLGGLADLVRRVVSESVTPESDYRGDPDLSRRSISSVRNDKMVRRGKDLLVGNGFKFIKVGQRNLFDFQCQFMLHFKKLSTSFLPSNYPTQLAMNLFETGTAEGLPGIPPHVPIIVVGYVIGQHGIAMNGIYMSYVKDGMPVWVHRLDAAASSSSQPNIVPLLPYDSSSNSTATRVRATDKAAGDRGDAAPGVEGVAS